MFVDNDRQKQNSRIWGLRGRFWRDLEREKSGRQANSNSNQWEQQTRRRSAAKTWPSKYSETFSRSNRRRFQVKVSTKNLKIYFTFFQWLNQVLCAGTLSSIVESPLFEGEWPEQISRTDALKKRGSTSIIHGIGSHTWKGTHPSRSETRKRPHLPWSGRFDGGQSLDEMGRFRSEQTRQRKRKLLNEWTQQRHR